MSKTDSLTFEYQFTNPTYAERGDDELKRLIEEKLPAAIDDFDETDPNALIRAEYAQDHIQQIRDILLSRSVEFTDEEKELLDFLTWPLSEEERKKKAGQDKIREAEEAKNRKLSNDHRAFMSVLIFNLANNLPLPDCHLLSFEGYTLSLHKSWSGLRGKDVRLFQDFLEAELNTDVRVSYLCSKAGINFESDPDPDWTVDVPVIALTNEVTKSPLRNFIIDWCCNSVEVWDEREDRPIDICSEIINDLFI